MQPSRTNTATIKLRPFDAGAVRQYFAGVEALAAEACATRDPRVLKESLQLTESEKVRWSHPPGLNRRPADYES